MSLRCVAVLCVRNEAPNLRRSLGDFVDQGIDVAVIDHGSDDGSDAILREFAGRGLVRHETLAWEGVYDQGEQLAAKAALIAGLDHDWVIHVDADEWLHTRRPGETLVQGIGRLAAEGYNAINFDEFVFLPDPCAAEARDLKRDSLHYYFFEPNPLRLMRAWRRDVGFDNLATGGHVLSGAGMQLAPESFVLRHYIVLSQAHAIAKYVGRTFDSRDLARGWHGNRLGLDAARLQLPARARLKRLARWDEAALDRADPKALHFWDWPRSPGMVDA